MKVKDMLLCDETLAEEESSTNGERSNSQDNSIVGTYVTLERTVLKIYNLTEEGLTFNYNVSRNNYMTTALLFNDKWIFQVHGVIEEITIFVQDRPDLMPVTLSNGYLIDRLREQVDTKEQYVPIQCKLEKNAFDNFEQLVVTLV